MSLFDTTNAPLLDFRGEGVHMVFPVGTSRQVYNFSHEPEAVKVSFFGVSIYAWDSNLGDKVNMWTEYWVEPLGQWKRYKKFAKNFNIYPKTEMKDILFPTTPTNGVRLVIEYNNTGIGDVNFFMNLYNFVDQQTVDLATASEGVDW